MTFLGLFGATEPCTREIPEPVPFLSWHGAQIGGIRFYQRSKKNMICLVHMYCGLSMKIKMRKTLHGTRRSWTYFVCVCFHVCAWSAKTWIPLNLSPMADDAITWGGIQGLGSPLYRPICALDTLCILQLGVTRLLDHMPLHTVCASLRITARPSGGIMYTSYCVL